MAVLTAESSTVYYVALPKLGRPFFANIPPCYVEECVYTGELVVCPTAMTQRHMLR